MAMRCWWSDEGVGRGVRGVGAAGTPPPHPPRPTPLLVLLLAACVTTTSVTYRPSAEQPRLTLDEGGRTLGRFVGVECERLAAAGRDSGSAVARVLLDSLGLAASSEVLTSSGDARVDGLVGAVTAQLRLDARPPGGTAAVRASWRCSGDAGATLVRLPDPDRAGSP